MPPAARSTAAGRGESPSRHRERTALRRHLSFPHRTAASTRFRDDLNRYKVPEMTLRQKLLNRLGHHRAGFLRGCRRHSSSRPFRLTESSAGFAVVTPPPAGSGPPRVCVPPRTPGSAPKCLCRSCKSPAPGLPPPAERHAPPGRGSVHPCAVAWRWYARFLPQ